MLLFITTKKTWNFYTFMVSIIKKVTMISQKKEWITINQMYSQNMLSNEFLFFSNFLNASNFIIIKRQKEKWCYT